jgi:hypothetical protein
MSLTKEEVFALAEEIERDSGWRANWFRKMAEGGYHLFLIDGNNNTFIVASRQDWEDWKESVDTTREWVERKNRAMPEPPA